MGSRTEFPSLDGGRGLAAGGHQYSIRTGYRPDRMVHGRKLSSIIEQGRTLDPSSADITQYMSGGGRPRKKSLLSEEVGAGLEEVDGGVEESLGSSLKVEGKLETLV